MRPNVRKVLILSAVSPNRPFTQAEITELTRKAMRRSITKSTGRLMYAGTWGQSYQIFDIYNLDELGFFKRSLYFAGKGFATALRYIGINTVSVVVKS